MDDSMYAQPPRERLGAALAAGGITALLGWALLAGLAGGAIRASADRDLALFSVAPPPPPERPRTIPRPKVSTRAEGRAAPPNIRSKATQMVAPVPVVVLPPPPAPVTVTLHPFAGTQSTQGATPVRGPGTGAGGTGDGTGSGGWGDGDGDGGDELPPRWRKGRLKDSDYPRDVGELGVQGAVGVKFLVWTDGRVRDCRITRSSGSNILDGTTCRLIQERFRYDPSRDGAGRPVPSWILETHTWVIEHDPAER